jgi:serine/threonine protein kinase
MGAGDAPNGNPAHSKVTISKRYTLETVLGHGAFGTTYLAHDNQLARRVVAKLIRASGENSANLFQQEVRVSQALAHPNIVKLLDFGASETGELYLVTEWVDGQDLAAILNANGPLDTLRSLAIARGIAIALRHIHEKGFVHRDLKPSNIIIHGWPSNPDFENPKILDFGVAGLLTKGRTEAGMIFGTPRYMSPEQVRGEPQTAATDVYGLGLLLFEMLTGHSRWVGTEQPEQLFHAILTGHLAFEELAAIPSRCAALIRRCLNGNPSERPSIGDVLQELERLRAAAHSMTPEPPTAPLARNDASNAVQLGASPTRDTMAAHLPFRRLFPSRVLSSPSTRSRLAWLAVVVVLCLSFVLIWIPSLRPTEALLLSVGGLLIVGGVTTGFWLRQWLGRRSSATAQAYDLASGAKSRVDLTATIAIQLDDLVRNLRALDERVLAGSVALMLKEYDQATDAKDRQSALMNVVTLSEKLAQRLSPWYVRHKDVIASGVAVCGAISGLITAYNALHGPHKP